MRSKECPHFPIKIIVIVDFFRLTQPPSIITFNHNWGEEVVQKIWISGPIIFIGENDIDQEKTYFGDIDAKGRRNWTNEGDLRSIPKGGSFSCSLAANEWEGVTGSYTPQCTLCSYNTCSYTTQIDKHKYTNTETQIHKYNANEWEGITGSYTPQCTVCSYVAFKIQQCQLNKTITSTMIQPMQYTDGTI